MRFCIANYGSTGSWYEKGQERLLQSLRDVGYNGDVVIKTSANFACPTHPQVPYGFKPYLLSHLAGNGYDAILWVDASFWAIKPLDNLISYLCDHECVLQGTEYFLGEWCSDAALGRFGMDREKAFTIPMFSAGFLGLNLSFGRSRTFLNEWLAYAKDGISFVGDWNNKQFQVSKDVRVLGHRHDMSVGSFLAHKLGMPLLPNNTFFSYYGWYEKYKDSMDLSSVCFVCRGM